MTPSFSLLTGRDLDAMVPVGSSDGPKLLPEVAEAFRRMSAAAEREGMRPAVASGFRDYERQLLLWNGKADGSRPVFDETGNRVTMARLDDDARLFAILRFSALPGASRHHWGTDFDVYDAEAAPVGYQVQLTQAESDGLFGNLHRWLDENAARFGFFRPYDADRGGVAPERWHLSYGALAEPCLAAYGPDVFHRVVSEPRLALRSAALRHEKDLYQRFLLAVRRYTITS